jgi:membrane associated rhomboid family serine protease
MDSLSWIKYQFNTGTILVRLVIINAVVFLLLQVFFLLSFLSGFGNVVNDVVLNWLALPADTSQLLWKPWTLFTYMFLHIGFMHILFNMLWLWWMSKIFLLYFDERQLLWTYILGGLSGGLLYILAFNLLPAFQPMASYSVALGASAAVIAIMVTVAVAKPDFIVSLLFVGPVQLRWIAIGSLVLDLIGIPHNNAGGHIAHLGGALFGLYYGLQLKKHHDSLQPIYHIWKTIRSLFAKKTTTFKVHHNVNFNNKTSDDWEYNANKMRQQQYLDKILEKISKSGYDSLSKEEKDFLFKSSK